MRSARFRVTLLPFALTLIVLGTMMPNEWRARAGWDGRGNLLDDFNNLLLFAPLGAALYRRRWWVIACIAGGLSSTAEILQMWDVSRFPSPYDVITNTLGALFAAFLYRRLRHTEPVVSVPINGRWLTAAGLVAVLILVLWNWPRPTTALASWDAEYPLLLGTDHTQDPPWNGTLADFTLLQRALSTREIRELGSKPFDARARFGNQVIYSDASPRRFPGATTQLPPETAPQMVNRLAISNAFTVIARITVSDLGPKAPAHIVSFSKDAENRNFYLSQEDARLSFGVRNAVSGIGGEDFHAESRAVLRSGTPMLVVATYDGAIARIYLDGALVARSNYVAWGCPVPAVYDTLLPLVWSILGAIAAVFALTVTLAIRSKPPGSLQPALVTVVCVGAGIFAELLLPHVAASHEWHRGFLYIGALLVAMSVVPEPSPATLPVRALRDTQPASRS